MKRRILTLVDFRLGNRRGALQEIEIAALVGLPDVLRENGAVPARVPAGRGFPGRFSLPQFFIGDRKSTRLNSSHSQISYAVFCLKKKKKLDNVQVYDPSNG